MCVLSLHKFLRKWINKLVWEINIGVVKYWLILLDSISHPWKIISVAKCPFQKNCLQMHISDQAMCSFCSHTSSRPLLLFKPNYSSILLKCKLQTDSFSKFWIKTLAQNKEQLKDHFEIQHTDWFLNNRRNTSKCKTTDWFFKFLVSSANSRAVTSIFWWKRHNQVRLRMPAQS